MKVILCTDSAVQWNDFELIPTVRMESQHSIGARTCHDFPRFVIISEKSRLEVGNRWRWSRFFFKKDPLGANFQKIIPPGFTTSQNHVLCANFVKFGWPEIGKVVCCLPDKKNKTSARSPALAQNLSKNILGVPQISSKSVHFRRSYNQTREHRWNVPQSISNTSLSKNAKIWLNDFVHTVHTRVLGLLV